MPNRSLNPFALVPLDGLSDITVEVGARRCSYSFKLVEHGSTEAYYQSFVRALYKQNCDFGITKNAWRTLQFCVCFEVTNDASSADNAVVSLPKGGAPNYSLSIVRHPKKPATGTFVVYVINEYRERLSVSSNGTVSIG